MRELNQFKKAKIAFNHQNMSMVMIIKVLLFIYIFGIFRNKIYKWLHHYKIVMEIGNIINWDSIHPPYDLQCNV